MAQNRCTYSTPYKSASPEKVYEIEKERVRRKEEMQYQMDDLSPPLSLYSHENSDLSSTSIDHSSSSYPRSAMHNLNFETLYPLKEKKKKLALGYSVFPPSPDPSLPCFPPTVTTPPLYTQFYDPPEIPYLPKYFTSPFYSNSRRNVFDRLTDPAFYTGVHRNRFDEFGNGRGLAGREYLYIHDGLTESATRTHEVYSSVVKKPRKAVVTPGTLGVQRFGVQIASVKLIWIFRNGDKHHDGSPFFLKPHIKTINCLYQELTKEINPITGPVRRLYDQNFRIIKDLDEIIDGAKYLCSSGEPPAQYDRLEKFLSEWIIKRSNTCTKNLFI